MGIYVDVGSSNNIFSSNTVQNSVNEGIELWGASNNNQFYNNIITNNGYTDWGPNAPGNRFCYRNCGTSSAAYGEYGMFIAPSVSNTYLEGNSFSSNAAGTVHSSSTSTIFGP